jgi:hypothetical protein
MNRNPLHLHAVMLALLSAAATPTQAQEPSSQRVEVSGTRYDVRSLCPAIEDDLRAQIARRLSLLPAEALVQVSFQLDGRRIGGVEMRGSTPDARKAMRQAVQQIGCDNGGAAPHRVRFDISYRWDDQAAGRTAAAPASIAVARVTAR